MTVIDQRFDGDRPISCAEGRYGDIIIAQGGVQPARWPGDGQCTDAGIEAPTDKPGLALDPTKNYYIARTDVTKPGAVYYAPPTVTYEMSPGLVPGVEAKAKSYLEQSAVSEIIQDEGGKYYPEEPTVVLGDSHGKGAELVAILDAPETYVADANNSPETGITGFDMISDGPPWAVDVNLPSDGAPTTYGLWPFQDIPLDGNGIFDLKGDQRWFWTSDCGSQVSYLVQHRTEVEVTGHVSGSGATVRVGGGGFAYLGSSCDCSINFCWFDFAPCTTIDTITPKTMGAGYSKEAEIAIIIPAMSYYDPNLNRQVGYTFGLGQAGKTGANKEHWLRAAIIRCYSGEDPRNPGSGDGGYAIKDIQIKNGGEGYLVAPQIKITSPSGFGAYATCKVAGGTIVEVTLENGGGGYQTPPKVEALAGEAEAFAIARPHLRGLYQCYYRFTDDRPESRGGPVPSNLSEVHELDAGEAATSVTWSWTGSSNPRVTHTELWRTTSGQATTVYRVARLEGGAASTFVDDLTDEELRDPDREGYAAMPILLPNGELNAMRFVPPPDDKSVVVKFQDRMWYGVDGELPNALYYSEIDEPESVPKENEVIIQQNDRDSDRLKAMIPFGQTLFLAQERHLFSLTFSQIPLIDGQVSPVAFRGCINQRCWQIHEGYCYAADHYGVYRFNLGGSVEDLSDPVFDEFEEGIDFSNVTWDFMSIDFATKTLRLFVAHSDDGPSTVPTRALCYDINSKTWWWEKYPQPITASTQATLVDGSFRTVYGCKSGLAILDYGSTDIARGLVLTATVTDSGAGYRKPPTVTVPGGNGARLQACLNSENEVAAIWIMEPGFGYTSGDLVLSAPDDPHVPAASRRQAKAVFTASSLDDDLPTWPTFHVKTGNVEYPTDARDKSGGTEQRRDISLAYKPTDTRNELSVRMYYNNSSHPRPNVTERDRGTGFVDSTVDPASRIDLGHMLDEYGADNGVSRAIRTGKSLEDIRSADRHVAVEVCGPRRTQDPLVIYTLDVFGGGGGAG